MTRARLVFSISLFLFQLLRDQIRRNDFFASTERFFVSSSFIDSSASQSFCGNSIDRYGDNCYCRYNNSYCCKNWNCNHNNSDFLMLYLPNVLLGQRSNFLLKWLFSPATLLILRGLRDELISSTQNQLICVFLIIIIIISNLFVQKACAHIFLINTGESLKFFKTHQWFKSLCDTNK